MPDPSSPEIVTEAEEFLIEQLWRDFCEIESLTISAREAAWRGDRGEIRLRLGQLRDLFRHAVRLFNLLGPAPPKERARPAKERAS